MCILPKTMQDVCTVQCTFYLYKNTTVNQSSYERTHYFCNIQYYYNLFLATQSLRLFQNAATSVQQRQNNSDRFHSKLEVLREHRPPLNAGIIDNPVNPDFGFLYLDSDLDVISWSLGHTPALHKISSKSVGNFFNPVNADFGIWNRLLYPDDDPDRHQNVISWSLGHTPALHKILSKSVGNFFDNRVNADFGLLGPGSGR